MEMFVRNKPSLVQFAIYEVVTPINEETHTYDKSEIEDVIRIKKKCSRFLEIESTFVGVDYIKNVCSEDAKWINYCIYETNRSGQGYRVIENLDAPIKTFAENPSSHNKIKLASRLIKLNDELKPVEGTWEGEGYSKEYNFTDTYLSVRAFFSREKVDDVEDLDRNFFHLSNVILDTKIPIITEYEIDGK